MGAWGRAYYRNTQGGAGDVNIAREEKLIKTPADYRAIDRARAKRIRKAEARRFNRALTSHTIPPRMVLKP